MQVMYILIGLPGSGKSTYAKKLEQHGVVRVNQDQLGSRKACERLAYTALQQGKSVVIDRCNATRSQRAVWIKMAKSFNVKVEFQWLDRQPGLCYERVANRKGHETVNGPTMAKMVLAFFKKDFQVPDPSEGADHVVIAASDEAMNPLVDQVGRMQKDEPRYVQNSTV